MNKKSLSERDICTKYITPALEKAGWDKMEQISFNGKRIGKAGRKDCQR